LSQISPAAAWYFIVIVCRFFALWGEKTTHKELNMIGKRKSFMYVVHVCASERKHGKRRKEESTALPKAKNADRVSLGVSRFPTVGA